MNAQKVKGEKGHHLFFNKKKIIQTSALAQ
jgi:hypothetical protein